MEIVAWLFIAGLILRVLLYIFDTGFGGPVWECILWTSTLAWFFGLVLALHVLGAQVEINWGWK